MACYLKFVAPLSSSNDNGRRKDKALELEALEQLE